eukprot:TRINITY_DN4894_c2_g2_i1.p1 TRINITY_DN4894_c2_g2~~TRINITY_DN4894_c2_g2_i1.p1  ORF type:complete len:281 (+),score=36.76 TRINITY_DN4894_c2_g2_i1:95-937(+)
MEPMSTLHAQRSASRDGTATTNAWSGWHQGSHVNKTIVRPTNRGDADFYFIEGGFHELGAEHGTPVVSLDVGLADEPPSSPYPAAQLSAALPVRMRQDAFMNGASSLPTAERQDVFSHGPRGMDGSLLTTLFGLSPEQAPFAHNVSCSSDARSGDVPLEWQGKTTVMLHRLARACDQTLMRNALDVSEFRGTFDFLYVPMEARCRTNKGYAFINFVSPSVAYYFRCLIKRFEALMPRAHSLVTPAKIQGLEANYRHFKDSVVLHGKPEHRPLFIATGAPR